MSERQKLPHRRGHTVVEIAHDKQTFYVGVGQSPDFEGAVAEVFVQAKRTSSTSEALARDAAILISLALRHGADVPGLAASMTRDEAGAPLTVIGAVLDRLARDFTPPPDPVAIGPQPTPPSSPAGPLAEAAS